MSPSLTQQAVGEYVRRLRSGRSLSVRELAARTGFSPSFISQVENGQASPSISSMEKIAHALGITLGDFFTAAGGATGSGHILRSSQRQILRSGWSNATVEALAPSAERLEPVLIVIGPGGRSGKHPYDHPTEQFAFILEGEVTLTLGPEEHQLAPGDTVMLLPGELRAWQNRGAVPARVLLATARGGIGSPARVRSNRIRMTDQARRVLRALVLFDKTNHDVALPLRRIATNALEGDVDVAAKALQDLDTAGCVRTDTMGWHSGWLTALGREMGAERAGDTE
jgi:transcriptional regulator with XRE-family HTH domain